MPTEEHRGGIDQVLAERKVEGRQFDSIEPDLEHERLRLGFRARQVLALLLVPLSLVVLSGGGIGLVMAVVVIAAYFFGRPQRRPPQKPPIDPASDRLGPPDWAGRCCRIGALVCYAILIGVIGDFIPLEFAIHGTRNVLAERGLTIAPSEAEALLTFGLIVAFFALHLWSRPESYRGLICNLMVFSAFLAWTEWKQFQRQNAFALWRVEMLVTEHLESHDGRWPESWEDLKRAHHTLSHRYGRSWSLEEIRARVEVDFDADPDLLARGKPGAGGAVPFEVISLRPRWKTARDKNSRDPNRVIFNYYRRKSASNEDRYSD